jgi:nicotinamidase-related amidase
MAIPKAAVLIIDMINTFSFAGGGVLLRQTERIVPAVVRLKQRAAKARMPVIYCNDNFGHWRSDFRSIVRTAAEVNLRVNRIVTALRPEDSDYFILKPRHSAFYNTALDTLLEHLGTERIVVVGIAGDGCVHSTAADGHVREFDVVVCPDATASQTKARNDRALAHLEVAKYARVRSSRSVHF